MSKTWNGETYTDKQWAFIQQYIICGMNATEAADRAGYQGDRATLASVGSENLRKPKIRKAIDAYLKDMAMDAGEVLARLAEQARADITDFVTFNQLGEAVLDLEQAKAAGKMHLIKKLYYTDDGELRQVELVNSQKALEMIGRYLGLFVERTFTTPVDEDFDLDEWRSKRRERRQQVEDLEPLPSVGEDDEA